MRVLRTDAALNASTKTVTFTNPVEIDRVLVIASNGVLIYNFASEVGTLAGLVLTLAHDTTSMADDASCQVFYEQDTIPVSDGGGSLTVDGSVSLTGTVPLPTGAATETTLAALNTKVPASPAAEHTTAGSPNAVRLTDGTTFYKGTTPSDTQPVSGSVTVTQATAANLKVDPSGVTSPVSVASLPLPTGASTAAKQPALGTAGTASTDVLSVQGIASMTALTTSDSSAQTKLDTLHTDLGHLTDGTQTGAVVGNVASSATDSGNPVKIAGKYNTTQPTFTDGQRGDAQVDTRGNLKTTLLAADSVNTVLTTVDNADAAAVVTTARLLRTYAEGVVFNGTSWDRMRAANSASTTTGTGLLGAGVLGFDGTNYQILRTGLDNADAIANSAGVNKLITMSRQQIYNGTTWDLARNNTTGAVVAAGATTTQTNVSLTTYNARFLTLLVNVSAVSGGTVTVKIDGFSSTSYVFNLLTSTALGTVAVTALQIGPGLPVTANLSNSVPLPRTVRITATVSGTITFGIDYALSV